MGKLLTTTNGYVPTNGEASQQNREFHLNQCCLLQSLISTIDRDLMAQDGKYNYPTKDPSKYLKDVK